MAYSLENATDLTTLGNAIRTKTGGSATMTVAEMATAVNGITTGGGGSSAPAVGMTYEETTDEQDRKIINVDLYGYIETPTFTSTQFSMPFSGTDRCGGQIPTCKSLCQIFPRKTIDWFLNNVYQLNINIHSNEANHIPDNFLQANNQNLGVNININSLPNNINFIGDYAFYRTTTIFSNNLFNNVRYIGYQAFFGSSISTLDLSNSKIMVIEQYAFYQCKNLTSVTIPVDNLMTGTISVRGYSFGSCSNLATVYFTGSSWKDNNNNSIRIDGVTFSNCNNLTDIYVPWSEGEVANAPWGATNATIHYNWTPSE